MNNCVAYPVVLLNTGKSGYAVRIPDFDQFTEGKDLADAIYMARDAIGMMGVYYEDMSKAIPEPGSAPIVLEKDEFITYVDIDFKEYRMKHEHRFVKKNCTIPYYLERAAEKQGINFSRVLAEALAERLGLPLNV